MKITDFGVENWINAYEKDCTYNLTNTCVGVLGVNDILNLSGEPEKTAAFLNDIQLNYGEIFGTKRLRRQIAGLYKTAKDENIVLAHGAIGANALTFLTLLEPKDEVITFLPIYQQHYSIPESIGATVKKIFLKEENNWQPDLEELKALVSSKTKLICLNNPNNPTGAVMDEKTLKGIIGIAEAKDAYILCDEVYRGLSFDSENSFSPSIFDLYDKAISTSSMSKTFSLPGLRLGWIVGPKDFVKKINQQRNYHVICVGEINDYLSSIALENKEKIIQNNLQICKQNLGILDSWINKESKITYIKPKAGTTAFLKYDLDIPSDKFCLKLQRETGVMFLPGGVFEMEKHLRIGYTGNSEELKTALDIFSDWLSSVKR